MISFSIFSLRPGNTNCTSCGKYAYKHHYYRSNNRKNTICTKKLLIYNHHPSYSLFSLKEGAVKKVPKKKGCDLAKKQDSSLFLWYN